MMTSILQWVEALSPFAQGILGSAVFALLVWLGSKILKWIKSLNRSMKATLDESVILKHWFHKHYVHTNGMYYFTRGYLFILASAFRWFLQACLAASFYVGVVAIIKREFLGVGFSIYIFLCLREASSWLEDKSSDSSIRKIDPKFREQILAELGNPRDDLDLMLGKTSTSKEQPLRQSRSKREKPA